MRGKLVGGAPNRVPRMAAGPGGLRPRARRRCSRASSLASQLPPTLFSGSVLHFSIWRAFLMSINIATTPMTTPLLRLRYYFSGMHTLNVKVGMVLKGNHHNAFHHSPLNNTYKTRSRRARSTNPHCTGMACIEDAARM